jgi:hypothetical protein
LGKNSLGRKEKYLPGSMEISKLREGEIKLKIKITDQEILKDLEEIEALYKDKKIDESQYLMMILLNKICKLLYNIAPYYLK